MDADYFRVKFQNNYVALPVANPSDPTYDLNEYYLGPDSITRGFEDETNVFLGYGFNVYAIGTGGKATYTGAGGCPPTCTSLTRLHTQSLGATYQAHGLGVGEIEKESAITITTMEAFTTRSMTRPSTM